MRPRMRRLLALGGVVSLLFCGLTFYVIRIRMAESLYPPKGTFSWWVGVSSTIRNIPTPGLAGEAGYFTSAGDGPKPPQDEVVFRSGAPEAEIVRQVRAYLLAGGYLEQPADRGELVFASHLERSVVHVKIVPADGSLQVTITQFQ